MTHSLLSKKYAYLVDVWRHYSPWVLIFIEMVIMSEVILILHEDILQYPSSQEVP